MLFCLLAVAVPTSAQQGVVSDGETGTPVPMALIVWMADGLDSDVSGRAEADIRGRFLLPLDWSPRGSIEVRALGHRPFVATWAEAVRLDWRFELESDPLQLESVVVTAAGRSQRRSEIAVPIARITAEEIRVAGAASAEALLARVPGLQAAPSAPVGSNIRIRGIGDSRVLVLVDGQPAGGALLENRDLTRVSLAGVERVEVVKGPLSSLYGSDALGGVINVITTRPEAGFRGDARVLSGGSGRYEADGSLSGGGVLRYRATASWRQQDQVPGLDLDDNTFARVWDVRSTLRYSGLSSVRLRGDFWFLRARQRWPVGGGFSGFNDNRGVTGWAEGAWTGGGGEWTMRVLRQGYEHLYRSARGDAPIAGADEELQVEDLWKGTLSYAVDLGGHRVDMGIEGARRSIESPDKILEDQAADDQLDLFAQDAWTLGGATISAGARATLNDRWGNAVSPTLGISAMPAGGTLRLRAVVGRGFRAPSFKELAWDFANLGAGYTVQGFADLEPESSWNVTAGATWAPSARSSIGVEAYSNRIDNLIETTFVGNNAGGLLIYSPRNLSRAETRGIEATGSLRLAGWDAQAEYVLLDAHSRDDDLPLDRRSRHSARLRLGRMVPVLNGLLLNASAHMTGDAPLVGIDDLGQRSVIGTQRRFVSLDAQATLELPSALRLVFGVDNLLDARPEGWQAVIERRFRVGLEARDLF